MELSQDNMDLKINYNRQITDNQLLKDFETNVNTIIEQNNNKINILSRNGSQDSVKNVNIFDSLTASPVHETKNVSLTNDNEIISVNINNNNSQTVINGVTKQSDNLSYKTQLINDNNNNNEEKCLNGGDLEHSSTENIANLNDENLSDLSNHLFKKILEDEEEDIGSNICNLCSSKLADARVLTCLHRFCFKCIEKSMNQNSEQIICPTCSQVSSFRYLVRDLISLDDDKLVDDDKIGSSNICTACKSGERSIGRCLTCDAYLCGGCASAHQTMMCFEKHQLNIFSMSNLPICGTHQREKLQFYCTTCQEFCCFKCIKLSHSNSDTFGSLTSHSYYEINDKLVRRSIENLKSLLIESKHHIDLCNQNIIDNNESLNELSINKESIEQAINEQYQSIKAAIDNYHKMLLERLNHLNQQKRLDIWGSLDYNSELLAKLEEVIKYGEVILKKNFDNNDEYYVDFLKLKELLMSQLKKLADKVKKSKSNKLESDKENMLKYIANDFHSLIPQLFGNVSLEKPQSPTFLFPPQTPRQNNGFSGSNNLKLDLSNALFSPTLSSTDRGSCSSANGLNGPTSSCPDFTPFHNISKFDGQRPPSTNSDNLLSNVYTTSYNSLNPIIKSNSRTPEPISNPITNTPLSSSKRSPSNSSNEFALNTTPSLMNENSSQLDFNDYMTCVNLSQLVLMSNRDNETNTDKTLVPSTPSPQLANPVPLDQENIFIKNINELAKFGNQQPSNGILTSPTTSSAPSPLGTLGRSGAKPYTVQIRSKFGELGSSKTQFSSPHGFCLGVDEEIVIADTNNHRICIYDKSGDFKYMFGVQGKEEGHLWFPRKVAMLVYKNGPTSMHPRYVVCDRGSERSRMQIFSRNGGFLKKIAIRYIDIVAGLAITASGSIVAVDSVSPTVFVISENGDLQRWFDCSEYMREPSDILVSGNEYYICDFKGHCVVVFNEDGQYLRRIGGDRITNFPNGIDISDAGDILVGDSHGNRFHVVVFDKAGNLLSEYECPYVKVSRCCGLKITSEGYVVTLAKNNHHVLILNTLWVA